MNEKYIKIAVQNIDKTFLEAEKEWPNEFIEDASITEDEEKLLQSIEKKPELLVKWEARVVQIKKIRGFLKTELDRLYAVLYVRILKESEINFSQREMERQIKANEKYIEISKAIEKCDIIISQIESYLSYIRNLHWDVKNMIEIKKLIYGVST